MLPDARTIYERFRAFPGSDWIAKPEPIAGVIRHIARARPRAILEVGAGIGTLTHAIVATLRAVSHPARVVSIEHDAFCLAALDEHLGQELAQVDVAPDSSKLAPGAFDFVIVDGGTLERGGYAELVATRGVVLVEGGRGPQRAAMEATGRRFIVAHIGSADWDGGWYWLVKFEPTASDRVRFAVLKLWTRKLIPVRRRVRQAKRLAKRLVLRASPHAQPWSFREQIGEPRDQRARLPCPLRALPLVSW